MAIAVSRMSTALELRAPHSDLMVRELQPRGLGMNLLFFGISSFLGGLATIAADCPAGNGGGCAIGAIQTVIGGLSLIGSGTAAYYGRWRRDENDVYHVYANHEVEGDDFHPMYKLFEIANHSDIRVDVHRDSATYQLMYQWNHERQSHRAYTLLNGFNDGINKRQYSSSQSQGGTSQGGSSSHPYEGSVDGDTGYGGEIAIIDTDYVSQMGLGSSSTDLSDAEAAYDYMLARPPADSTCILWSYTAEDENGSSTAYQVATMRVQPATSNNYADDTGTCYAEYQDLSKRQNDGEE